MDLRSGLDPRSSALAILGLGLAAALLTGFAPPLHALVIDDFEDGPFDLLAPAATTVGAVQLGLPAFHCIASERDVVLRSLGSGPAGAQLHLVAVNDEVATVMPEGGGGRLELRYRPLAPVDLTAGGSFVKMVFQMTVAVPGGATIEVTLEDAAGVSDVEDVAITAPGPFYEIPLSGYAAHLDRTAIRSILVVLSAPTQGDYHLADIRMAKPYSKRLAYDEEVAGVSGPPYPTAPLEFGVDILPPDLAEPHVGIQRLQISLLQAGHCQPPDPCIEFPIEMRGMDSGEGAVRIGGPEAFARLEADHHDHGFTGAAHLFWDGGPPPDDGIRFELSIHLLPDGALAPTLLGTPEVFAITEEGFAIRYRVAHRDRFGMVRVISEQEMVFEVGEGQDLSVFSLNGPVEGAGGGNESRLGFTLRVETPPDPIKPLLEVTLTGEQVNEANLAVEGSPAPSTRVFWAQPMVMRSHTELRLAIPLDRSGVISVHDLQGRTVRLLEVPRGTVTVPWDGRDESGSPVPAGLYLARLEGLQRDRVARVIRVR